MPSCRRRSSWSGSSARSRAAGCRRCGGGRDLRRVGRAVVSRGPRRRRARGGRPRAGRRRGRSPRRPRRCPSARQVVQSRPASIPWKKPAAKRSPAPVASTTATGRRRVEALAPGQHVRPAGADGADGDRDLAPGPGHRRVEVVGQVERLQLVLVGDEQVDVGADHPQELVAVALDAEGVGEGDADPAAGALRGRTAFSKAAISPGRRSGSLRGRSTRPPPSRPRRCRRGRGTPRPRGRCSSTARRRR